MVCPETGETFSIASIRGDRRVEGKTIYGLRLWENDDLVPRPDDVFQERLYCVRWVETYLEENRQGKRVEKVCRHYCSVDEDDLAREEKTLSLLKERFADWQEKGIIPNRVIERGEETSRLQRERGWTHWHHLFNPRQLLVHGVLMNASIDKSDSKTTTVAFLLLLGSCANWNSKLCMWNSNMQKGGGLGVSEQTFANQALNTQFSYPIRTGQMLAGSFLKQFKIVDINNKHYS